MEQKKCLARPIRFFIASNYSDDFLSSGMDDAVIKVKAYEENETFSLWSDEMSVSKFDF